MKILGFGRKAPVPDDFEHLIETHLDGLYRVALRYTRDEMQAEDLVHDTVMRALRFRDRFELGTNFRAWMYTILTNTFIHRYRRQKREREILEGATREDVQRELRSEAERLRSEYPESAYLDHMLSDDVVAALDGLAEDFRNVVVLCDIEGLSYKEIAEVLDCPVGTVMSRLYRGRRLLEKRLAGIAAERGILRAREAAGAEGTSVRLAAGDGQQQVVNMIAYRRRKSG